MELRSIDAKIRGACTALALCLTFACDAGDAASAKGAPTLGGEPPPPPSAEQLVLAPREGNHPLDQRIRTLQQRVPGSQVGAAELDRLGWTFVARARELGDAGSYHMALQCALAIDAREPGSHAALLLRGHALHSLHRFREAEPVARRLVQERGLAFDHGLLGDVLADRGQLDQAIVEYQRMVDLRPDAHSYARAGHARFLKGDLSGALEVTTMAARAASPRNRESFAWTWAQLARLQLLANRPDQAADSAARALERFPQAQAALQVQAQIALLRGQPERALVSLRAVAQLGSHPDALWMLIETAQALGLTREAEAARRQLLASGQHEDARAFARYLATRGEQLALAQQLIERELQERADVYSHETLALVQSAQGRHEQALASARRSLEHGTADPRLHYHAGLIAARAGDPASAARWLRRASELPATLLPSQRARLDTELQAIAAPKTSDRYAATRSGHRSERTHHGEHDD